MSKHTFHIIGIVLFLILITGVILHAKDSPRTVHTLVALCDNKYQGIIPVKEVLGNGDDLRNNLYWGALYGVRSIFDRNKDWELLRKINQPFDDSIVLERVVYKHNDSDVYLVADAYRGREIKRTISDFIHSLKGCKRDSLVIGDDDRKIKLSLYGDADLMVYIGHDGLMEFTIEVDNDNCIKKLRDAVILCCASKYYFSQYFNKYDLNPIVWTDGLMAPEAYILEGALEGWIINESVDSIRNRAAQAYSKYQKCSLKSAKNLIVTGW